MVKPLRGRSRGRNVNPLFKLKLGVWLRKGLLSMVPYLFTLVFIGLLFGGAVAYAVTSPVFRLADVRILNIGTVTQEQAFNFCELHRGENLIQLDLVAVQQVIKRKYPEFKEVRVRRVLPNRIEVVLKRRTPAAQVFLTKYYQIDRDLVVLRGFGQSSFRNLMVIEGIEAPSGGIFAGQTLKATAAKKAMALADMIRRLPLIEKHQLSRINVQDPKNIIFFLDEDVEVRIGGNHFEERLKVLNETMKTVDVDPAKIRYIDLRFDDVVIGPR